MLTVYRPGTPVTLAGEITGGIIQVCIGTNDHVTYQVAWWDGNTRRLEWLEEIELIPAAADATATLRIGFASGGN